MNMNHDVCILCNHYIIHSSHIDIMHLLYISSVLKIVITITYVYYSLVNFQCVFYAAKALLIV